MEDVSPQSDLYALGVVVYEMLIGELPYDAETPAGIVRQQLSGRLRSPKEVNPNIPEQVNAVTLRLLATDPKDRYPDAAALIDDLKRVLRSREDGDGRVEEQSTSSDSMAEEGPAVTITEETGTPDRMGAGPCRPERFPGKWRTRDWVRPVMLRLETGMSHTLGATFDGNVFRPDEPVGLRPNTRVRLIVEPAEDPERSPGSFLRVARSLGLEGPPDWSSRLDEYLYGAKDDS